MNSPILKRILLGLAILFGLAVIGTILLTKTYGFRYSDKQYSRVLSQKGAEASIQYDTIAGQSLRSIHVGKEAETTIAFLHGSPGSSRDFERYLGDSSLYLRANLLAPALDPHNEKQFAFNNWIKRPPLKLLTSPAIQAALVEKLNHENDLMVLMNDWDKVTCPVIIMHGQEDWIVPDVNIEFLNSNLSNAPMTVINPEDMSHSLIWTSYDAIHSEITSMLE